MKMIKMLKRLDLYVLIGLSYILFVIWNRLRIKLPREVPFEIHPEILSLLCKTLPIILIILLFLEIKNKYFPQVNNKYIYKLKLWVLKNLLYFKPMEILDKICARLAKRIYDLEWNGVPIIIEKLLYLFNYFLFGKKAIPEDTKYDLNKISESRRFIKLYLWSAVIIIFPAILIYIIGIIECYIIGRINYFYILLPIWLTPMIWKGFLYVITEYCISRMIPESNPGFNIKFNIKENTSHHDQTLKDFELFPMSEFVGRFTETEIKIKEAFYSYYFYIWHIAKHLQLENTKNFKRIYIVVLFLRILLLGGMFYH